MGYFDHDLGEWVEEDSLPKKPHVLTHTERSRGGKIGGKVTASRMTPEERRARAQKAGRARGKRHVVLP